MFFLFWTSLWALWGILVRNNATLNLFLIIIYLILIVFLTSNQIKQQFSPMYRYGQYALYTQMVNLKSGLQIPIYFFSDHIPKSGQPTTLPDGYIVQENAKSHMPYLKKDRKPPHKIVKSENKKGIQPIIYVVKNPQSGSDDESWTVRLHKEIMSSHPTKQLAINKAREIALQQQATVMVQNTNGQFSYGFKPKKSSPKK